MSAKKLQNKIFGTSSSASSGLKASPSDPGLTINIPKPPPSAPNVSHKPHIPGAAATTPTARAGNEPPTTSGRYRDKIVTRLQSEYQSVERYRLLQDERKERHWKKWGPYLSERQWVSKAPKRLFSFRSDFRIQATVREDYSHNGDAWSHFPHSQARSRAYRWGEDGLAGISDNHQNLCFSLALWNGVDPILKERLFGVTGHQGNHGEDVKELYYYLDSTPTHSYMKYLYKYPQRPYPYEELVRESSNRSRDVDEYEILDTDAFEENRYWDVFVEYAKDDDDPNAISIRITAYNRGPDPATLHLLPQLWFRNTWSWPSPRPPKPLLYLAAPGAISAKHPNIRSNLYCLPSPPPVGPSTSGEIEGDSIYPNILFSENETNFKRLYGGQNESGYAKDAFHDHLIPSHRPPVSEAKHQAEPNSGDTTPKGLATPADTPDLAPKANREFVNPTNRGTKAAAHYLFHNVPGNGGCVVVRCKLTPAMPDSDPGITDEEVFDVTVDERREEADEFYHRLAVGPLSDDLRSIMRQALAGMLW